MAVLRAGDADDAMWEAVRETEEAAGGGGTDGGPAPWEEGMDDAMWADVWAEEGEPFGDG